MSAALGFLQSISKHLLDCGRVVFDRKWLGDNVKNLAENYFEETPVPQIRDGLVALFALSSEQVAPLVADILARSGLDAKQQHALGAYLEQVPGSMRRMLPEGVDARSIVDQVVVQDQPGLFAQYLPPRVPRFRVHDRPETIDRWVLLRMLGQGGFGEVWLARHPDFHSTQAAFKFCIGDHKQRERLRHEAKVLNQVMSVQAHPGVVRLLNARLDADPPWLQYEFIAGGELGTLVREWSKLPLLLRVENVNRVILDLAKIVGYFHSLTPAVIHRDLKPPNILVERLVGGDWKLRIADFGIGNVSAITTLDREQSVTSPTLQSEIRRSNTAIYSSPQQRDALQPSPSDDVYALGVIWYQLLIDNPVARAPVGDWMPAFLRRGFTREYVELLGSCMENDANKRPKNAEELARLLQPRPSSSPAKVAPVEPTPVRVPEPSPTPKSEVKAIVPPASVPKADPEKQRREAEAKEAEEARQRIERMRREVEERQKRTEMKLKQDREAREAEQRQKEAAKASDSGVSLELPKSAKKDDSSAIRLDFELPPSSSDSDVLLAPPGETELRNFFRKSLDHGGGQVSKQDNTTANQMVRLHGISPQRAKEIFQEAVRLWNSDDLRLAPESDSDTFWLVPPDPASKSKSKPNPPASESNEFELTLDSPPPVDSDSDFELSLDESAIPPLDSDGKDDIFETDFELPPPPDEASDEVVLLDDEEPIPKPKKKRKKKDSSQVVALDLDPEPEVATENPYAGLSAFEVRNGLLANLYNIQLRQRYLEVRTPSQKQMDRKHKFWTCIGFWSLMALFASGFLWVVGFILGVVFWGVVWLFVSVIGTTTDATWDEYGFNVGNGLGVFVLLVSSMVLWFGIIMNRRAACEQLGPLPPDVFDAGANERKTFLGQ